MEKPEVKHLTKVTKRNEDQNVDFQFHVEGNNTSKGKAVIQVWRDLQLPVYYHNLNTADESPTKGFALEVGYIILPADGPATAEIWKNYAGYSMHALKAIELITLRLRDAKPEFFSFERNAKYPVYENFSKRKPETYLDVEKLGTTEAPRE
jgi:hypothetical protein